jgi:2-polyprenyl-3-methyl-5-hydroxy-6-metoxy-1,4-benzoquinol methylase
MAMQHDPEGAEVSALGWCVPSFAGYRVLEIGCGDGRLTRRYAGAARSVVAIDPDAAAIATLRATVSGAHVEARAVTFERFDAEAERFDLILLSWSL